MKRRARKGGNNRRFRLTLRPISYIMLTTQSVSFAPSSPGLSPNPATSSLPLPTARTIANAARFPANSPAITSGRTLAASAMPSGQLLLFPQFLKKVPAA